jgi:integrase
MPKSRGPHRLHKLSAVSISKLGQGFHSDGGGLYLKVDGSGARRWVSRIRFGGHTRDIGLGGFPVVKLVEARAKAAEVRALVHSGKDPRQALRGYSNSISFEQAARQWYDETKSIWSKVHARQVIQSLEDNAFPKIGGMALGQISKTHIHDVLLPIWSSKHSVAKRLKSWLSRIFDWAHTKGYCGEINPCDGVEKGLPKISQRVVSHASLDWRKVPEFIAALENSQSLPSVISALKFLILTAARTQEVRGAKWDEFDFKQAIWRIPAHRMKGNREHVVPLTAEMLSALGVTETGGDANKSGLVFPGLAGKALSENTLLKATKLFDVSLTVHGFRSSFRTWAADTGQPFEVAEAALAHEEKSKIVKAYQRSDMIDRRRLMMADWTRHCCTQILTN